MDSAAPHIPNTPGVASDDLPDTGSIEADNLARTIIVPPGAHYIERIVPGPWLNVLGAARWLGNPCVNGRAPNSVYEIVQQIGGKLNGRWIVHSDDLDTYIRGEISR